MFRKLFILLLIVWPVALLAGEGEKLLDRFMEKTTSMQADFTQTLKTGEGEVLQQSSGTFYLLRPGKFRWNYIEPYAQQIVSDGERVWVYDVALQQVTVQKQNITLSQTPMELLQNRARLDQSFDISELGQQGGVYRLQLTPKSSDGDFNKIILGMDETGLRSMQLHDQFDQITDIRFSNLEVNTDLAGGLFNFVPPEGVDVLGGP